MPGQRTLTKTAAAGRPPDWWRGGGAVLMIRRFARQTSGGSEDRNCVRPNPDVLRIHSLDTHPFRLFHGHSRRDSGHRPVRRLPAVPRRSSRQEGR